MGKYGDAGIGKAVVTTAQETREKAGKRKVVGFTILESTDIEMSVAAKHLGFKKYELLELMWEDFKERNADSLLGIK